MGCNCGKGRRNNISAGTLPSSPLIIGQDDANMPVRRVVLLQASAGIPAGATRYVRGTEVDNQIQNQILRLA